MEVSEAYDRWSDQYDTDRNRTRDMEALVLRRTLDHVPFSRVLEIGCGTGKNTVWLVERAEHITAVDLSEGMLAQARKKLPSDRVVFRQGDILRPWSFTVAPYDLVTFSLVLEHIADLGPMLRNAAQALAPGGHVYIGELHPFKQYSGTKARFTTESGTEVVSCFDHHISEFVQAAQHAGLHLVRMDEHFDEDDPSTLPRILVLLFRK